VRHFAQQTKYVVLSLIVALSVNTTIAKMMMEQDVECLELEALVKPTEEGEGNAGGGFDDDAQQPDEGDGVCKATKATCTTPPTTHPNNNNNNYCNRIASTRITVARVALLVVASFVLFDYYSTKRNLPTTTTTTTQNKTMIVEAAKQQLQEHQQQVDGWKRPAGGKIFGLVHVAKTGGTTINGALAARYERVCGNKGNSYDSYMDNQRAKKVLQEMNGNGVDVHTRLGDVFDRLGERANRGSPPGWFLQEVGFDDCDYISMEKPVRFWERLLAGDYYQPPPSRLELHVPCRDPIQHLLSGCNFHGQEFDCTNPNVAQEVGKCISTQNAKRMNARLVENEKIELKCFNPIPVQPYLTYMGGEGYLQHKRIKAEFVSRASNTPRNKTAECLPHDPALQETVLQIMRESEHGFFYQFCSDCMGSADELKLPLVTSNRE